MCRRLFYLISLVLVLSLVGGVCRADIIGAEEMLVDLRADDLQYGEGVTIWPNHGTLGNFSANGNPVVEDVAGLKAVTFDGDSWFNGPTSTPGIEGAGTRSIEVWAYNPSIPDEETTVSWSHRGGPDGSNMSFNYGQHGTWGAVGHWGAADMAWGGNHSPSPATNTWWHLAYTYDGTAARVYVNGEQSSARDPLALDTYGGNIIRVAAQADDTGAGVLAPQNFTGSIAAVRIHDGVLSQADIQNNYEFGFLKAWNPDPADGSLLAESDFPGGMLGKYFRWTAGGTAASNDVFFGTNYADVEAGTGGTFLGNQTDTYLLVGYGYTPNDPLPDGLVPGTTYYWRIDGIEADGVTKHTGSVWSVEIAPTKAYGPTPVDGSDYVDPDADLSWVSGMGIIMQTLYIGDDYDAVKDATTDGVIVGDATTYDPDPLELDTVYYWRVDTAGQYGDFKGDVWSFKTLPIVPVTDPNLLGWWKFDEGSGSTAVDWSGYGNHATLRGDPQWVPGFDGDALDLDGSDDYVVLPIGGVIASLDSTTITTWVDFSNSGGGWQRIFDFGNNTTTYMFLTPRIGTVEPMRFGITIEGGGDPEQVMTAPNTLPSGWHHVAVTINAVTNTHTLYLDGVVVASNAAATLSPSDLGNTTNNWLGRSQWAADGYLMGALDDFRIYDFAMTADEIPETMRGDPRLAWNPNPAIGSTPDIEAATPLTWSPGDNASQHDIYFGTDENAVDNADISDTTGIYRDRRAETSYTPDEGVEWGGGPYYWRIDEYNTDGIIIKGRIWSFSVADFLSIDDFEDYNVTDKQIWAIWHDGLGYWDLDGVFHPGNQTGSAVGDEDNDNSYMEETIVNVGSTMSMPYFFNNNDPTKAKYSEAKMTLSNQRDWTEEGVKALSLWFQGY
ncbi:MAG: LamG domain-containing protein, partial [Planctomycetota bacterium]